MSRTSLAKSRHTFTTFVPEGMTPPARKTVKQCNDLLLRYVRMDAESQQMFCNSLIHDEASPMGILVNSLSSLLENVTSMHLIASEWQAKLQTHALRLEKALLKHRKPVKNAERDTAIVSLRNAGKTEGDIVRALRGNYPTLTAGQVRAVVSRDRKNKAAAAHGS